MPDIGYRIPYSGHEKISLNENNLTNKNLTFMDITP